MKKMTSLVIAMVGLYFLIMLLIYFYQEKFLFHPLATDQNHKYAINQNFVERYFDTPNHGRLHGLHFKVENSKGLIFYLHGNAGNLEQWAHIHENFTPLGYDVFIVDYRKFGKSTGAWREDHFFTDSDFIYKVLKKEYLEKEIIIYGRSIGTGMATQLASNNSPKALILESPFFNVLDLAKPLFPFFPVKKLLKYKFESNVYIQKVKAPIYILHGKLDKIVPFASGLKLYQLIADRAKLISFEEGNHSNLNQFKKYHLFLKDILN